jgi:hypothetical protein
MKILWNFQQNISTSEGDSSHFECSENALVWVATAIIGKDYADVY